MSCGLRINIYIYSINNKGGWHTIIKRWSSPRFVIRKQNYQKLWAKQKKKMERFRYQLYNSPGRSPGENNAHRPKNIIYIKRINIYIYLFAVSERRHKKKEFHILYIWNAFDRRGKFNDNGPGRPPLTLNI